MVELYVSEILSRASGERAFIMLLQEKEGLRKLPVLIGPSEAQAVAFAKRNVHFSRPVTHDLFKSFAEAAGATLLNAAIYKMAEGTFYSHLVFQAGEREFKLDARTSDAVAVAMRCGAPIYIDDGLLNMLCVKEEWENAISIPITLAGTDTLREVMQRAIKDENYELAMKVKEELDARAQGDEAREESPEGMNN